MSEELTEKWKKKELPLGSYYVKDASGRVFIDEYIQLCYVKDFELKVFRWEEVIVEVVERVPSHYQFSQMVKKVDELTTKCNQLKQENSELVQKIHILNESNVNLENTVGKFGEQLKEANDLLLGFLDENICSFDHNGYCQEHSSTEPDYRCIQQQLKWYFKKYEV